MRISRILRQHRRDFWATYFCEHCGYEHDGEGYDDDNFHKNVVPKMKCHMCHKTAPANYKPRDPKYHKDQIV